MWKTGLRVDRPRRAPALDAQLIEWGASWERIKEAGRDFASNPDLAATGQAMADGMDWESVGDRCDLDRPVGGKRTCEFAYSRGDH
jgi:hypothetical protein